jgi:peptide/nickel transport system permease protein
MRPALAAVLRGIALVAALAVITFFLIRVMPGDVVDVLAAEGDFDAGAAAELRAELGLDRDPLTQFGIWLVRAAGGDLGLSLRFERPVTEMIGFALPGTLELAGRALAIGLLLGFGLALGGVLRPKLFGPLVQAINVWSIALPTFCVGLLFILVFAIWLRWVPVLRNTWLASLVLALDIAGQVAKPLAEELRELVSAAYVRTARAKGLSPLRIAARHMLPAALPVVVALAGLILAGLIGGTLTMEVLFGLPGLGTLAMQAIAGRDYPLLQAVVLLFGVGVVLVNTLTDATQALIDPRQRGLARR